MNPQQAAGFLEALSTFAKLVSDTEKHESWLKEMKELIEENEKQVKLIGAPGEIERNLVESERARVVAESVLEEAQAEAEKLVKEAEAGLEARDADLKERSKHLDDLTAEQRAENDKALTELRNRQESLDAAVRAYESSKAELDKALIDFAERETNLTEREAAATKATQDAEDLAKRVQEAARMNG